ncbi:MAG: hypothetical protein MSG64_10280 [Pyrinomonadaceae bacterium MAG19_C2-C3]|nr:hypothetical protein [Pyrinomonadaceae bacterium MAG19_C2-C3]
MNAPSAPVEPLLNVPWALTPIAIAARSITTWIEATHRLMLERRVRGIRL